MPKMLKLTKQLKGSNKTLKNQLKGLKGIGKRTKSTLRKQAKKMNTSTRRIVGVKR